MAKQDNHDSETLQSFVEWLDTSHYDPIDTMCGTAKEQAEKLQQEMQQTASQYVTLCKQLIGEIQHYISIKKEQLVPYVHSLSEKDAAGHDCRNCTGTGSCSLKHDMQLIEINQSHQKIKDIIYRLQMVSLPLYSETIRIDLYKILQNQMALLENKLAALVLLEETYLVPKITKAQMNINVHD